MQISTTQAYNVMARDVARVEQEMLRLRNIMCDGSIVQGHMIKGPDRLPERVDVVESLLEARRSIDRALKEFGSY